jgi:peptidyl-prolyl cis-trans isomerase B (cyclophilin B)
VFGQVVDGMDVVDDIRFVKTGRVGPMGDVPVEPVLIESVEVH